jgi:hypothetical protein
MWGWGLEEKDDEKKKRYARRHELGGAEELDVGYGLVVPPEEMHLPLQIADVVVVDVVVCT